MPIRMPGQAAPTTTATGPSRIRMPGQVAEPETPGTDETPAEGFPWGKAALSTGVAAALGLLAHNNPALMSTLGGKALQTGNALRMQSMLSGQAPLKSAAGNLGAAIEASLTTKSWAPIKELLSMQTLREALPEGATVGEKLKNALVTGRSAQAPNAAGGVNLPGVLGGPGRVMSALDTAAQHALQRGGVALEDAERLTFQKPLTGDIARGLKDNPAADFVLPFRRTQFNQFNEGLQTLKGEDFLGRTNLPVLAGYTGTGAAYGYTTADKDRDLGAPYVVALAARFGLPTALAIIAGRAAGGSRNAGGPVASAATPVSEYGLSSSIEDPFGPFNPTKSGAYRALKQITGR